MITNKDIEKMKKVFATKDDLKNFATKNDIKGINQEMNRFATKEDIKKELQKYATKENFKDLNKDLIRKIDQVRKDLNEKSDKIILTLAEDIGDVIGEVREIKDELKGTRVALGDQENRLQKVERKVFPQT